MRCAALVIALVRSGVLDSSGLLHYHREQDCLKASEVTLDAMGKMASHITTTKLLIQSMDLAQDSYDGLCVC